MRDRHSFRTSTRTLTWFATVIALSATLLAGCSFNSTAGSRLAANQSLVFPLVPFYAGPHATVVPALVLDPAFEGDVYSLQILTMIQTTLVTFDSNMNLIPDAAQSWAPSDGGKTWTFKLRPNLKWNDGTPLTAADFAAGILHDLDPAQCNASSIYNSAASSGVCNQLAPYLSYIQGANQLVQSGATTLPQSIPGIETPDSQTLIFHLTDAITFFPQQMATAAGIPLERSVFAKYGYSYFEHFPEGVAQSGPFMITSYSNPSDPTIKDPEHATVIHMVRNPDWWGKAPALTSVTVPLYDDLNAEYNDYVNGKSTVGTPLDFATVPSHEYPFSRDLADFHQIETLSIDYFGIDQVDAPFTSLRVRQAFDLALNKQLLVDSIFQGARTPTNHVIPLGIAGYNADLRNPPDNSATPSLTGNQGLAQQFIQLVAQGCLQRYDDNLCPYIIGTTLPTTSVRKVAAGGQNCPDYLVGVAKDNPAISSQKPIYVWVTPSNPDRVSLVQAAVAEWSTILCLNIQTKIDTTGHVLNTVFNPKLFGKPTDVGIWTLGWVADYPDAQDFTTNLFDPTSTYDSSNVGYPQGQNADLITAMHTADKEPNVAQRQQDYAQIEQQLVDDVAWIPYDQPKYLYRLRTQVQGLVIPAGEFIPDQSWTAIFITA